MCIPGVDWSKEKNKAGYDTIAATFRQLVLSYYHKVLRLVTYRIMFNNFCTFQCHLSREQNNLETRHRRYIFRERSWSERLFYGITFSINVPQAGLHIPP